MRQCGIVRIKSEELWTLCWIGVIGNQTLIIFMRIHLNTCGIYWVMNWACGTNTIIIKIPNMHSICIHIIIWNSNVSSFLFYRHKDMKLIILVIVAVFFPYIHGDGQSNLSSSSLDEILLIRLNGKIY